jgi:O-antigen/teichoic acid export membrane protein
LTKVLLLILSYLFINNEYQIDGYSIIFTISGFVGNFLLILLNKDIIIQFKYYRNFLSVSSHIKPLIILFIPVLLISFYTILNKIILVEITNSNSELAYFDRADSLVKLSLTFILSFSQIISPRNSKLFSQDRYKEVIENIKNSISVTFFLAVPLIILFVFFADFIVYFLLGNDFISTSINIVVLSPIIFLIGLSTNLANDFLIPIGKFKTYTLIVFVGSISSIFLNISFISEYQSLGAAFATLFTEIIILIVILIFVRKDFSVLQIIKSNYFYIFGGLVMILSLYLMNFLISNNLLINILVAFVSMFMYILIIYMFKKNIFFLKNYNF